MTKDSYGYYKLEPDTYYEISLAPEDYIYEIRLTKDIVPGQIV